MEIQGLSLLSDIKISLKKRLFRHIINIVERKLQKDYSNINSDHFIQIMLHETQAVHRLLDDVIIGKFQKKVDTIQKLLKIMNRNVQICLYTFQRNMGLFMLHLDDMKMRNIAFQRPLTSVKKYMKKYLAIVLNCCYYTHVLRMHSGANSLQFQQFIIECKTILTNFTITLKHSYQHSIVQIQTLLLTMAINIKNNNFEEAKNEFYQAIAHILRGLKKLEIQSAAKNVLKNLKRKCELFNLMIIALINNQRLLIQCDISIGWEIGFNLLKSIEKQIRFQQTGWRKYIRKQYEYHQLIQSSKMDQIRQFFIPIVIQESSAIKMLTQSFKQTKNYANTPLLHNFICTKKPKQHKRTCYSTKMECTQALEQLNDQPVYVINTPKTKRNIIAILNQDYNKKKGVNKNYLFSQTNKSKLKLSKGCSIDWPESARPENNFINNAFKNQKTKQSFKRKTERKEQSSNSTFRLTNQSLIQNRGKMSKRITQSGNLTYCLNNSQMSQLYDQNLKNQRDLVRLRKQHKILHYYINQENYIKNINNPTFDVQKNKLEAKNVDDRKNDNKSLQINLLDNLIQLLSKNKKRLKIENLAEKYDLAKKRKKIRDYQVQMIEYELNKNISKFFMKNFTPREPSIDLTQNLNQTIFQSVLNLSNFSKLKQERQKFLLDQKKLANAHNKSKQVIAQMLKKITHPQMFQQRKNGRSSLQKNSLSSLKFSIID